jgi:stage II sporulation protein M
MEFSSSSSASPMRLYTKENMHLYMFVSILFIMGVGFGALMVNALTLEQKQDLSRYLGSFFQTISLGGDNMTRPSLMQTFGLHFKWIMLLWLLGVSVVGLPLILVLDFLKGLLVGFTVGVLISQYSWKGMLFVLVSVAPQNILIVPVLMICSVAAISFSIYIVKHRFLQKTSGSAAPTFVSYTSLALSLIAVLFAVSVFETYVSPIMISWIAPSLLETVS